MDALKSCIEGDNAFKGRKKESKLKNRWSTARMTDQAGSSLGFSNEGYGRWAVSVERLFRIQL